MSSIYDELYRRRVSRRQPTVAEGRRRDFSAERISLVDGVAITPAGVFQMGEGLPKEAPLATPCPLFTNAQGFPRLVKPISTIALSERHLGVEGRLSAIWDFLTGSVDVLIRQLPDDDNVDLVVTLPDGVSPWLQQSLQQRIIEQLKKRRVWQEGQSHCTIGSASTLNTLLAPDTSVGAMRWVFWCCIDSLLDDAQLYRWDGRFSTQSPLIAGEGGALMLFERAALEAEPTKGLFWVQSAQQPHASSSSAAKRARTVALKALVSKLLPAHTSDQQDDGTLDAPAWCIMDMGSGDRAGDAFMALFGRWAGVYEPLVNCYALDHFCGCVGDAALGLSLMMAAAAMQQEDSAMLLMLGETDVSAMTLLTPVDKSPQA